jgi:kynureninase
MLESSTTVNIAFNPAIDPPPFRSRFVVDDSKAYLDGNSLGRLPKRTKDLLQQVIAQQWGEDLISGWNAHWLSMPRRIGNKIGQLIGAHAGETIVSDSTSVNLFKLASALLQQSGDRVKIITDRANFPSDLYVLAGCGESGSRALEFELMDLETCGFEAMSRCVCEAIDDATALVSLSHVHYKSGFAYDIESITRAAHQRGARVLWDLSHSVGVLPMQLSAWNVDAVVGCTYKYLNGGPGAPAFLYLRSDLHALLNNPIRGWFGAKNPFSFSMDYTPSPEIERFLVGTPPILSLAAIEPGVDLVLEAGIEHLRERSIQLSSEFIALVSDRLLALGFSIQSPLDAAMRGSHVSLGHPHAWQITQDLIQRFSVIPDFRAPGTIRFGFAPIYTTRDELHRAIQAMEASIQSQSYLNFPADIRGVT